MGLAEGGSQPIRPLGYFRSHMPYLEQVCNGWKGEEATPSLTGLWQPYTSDGRSYANELGPPMPSHRAAGFSCPEGFSGLPSVQPHHED